MTDKRKHGNDENIWSSRETSKKLKGNSNTSFENDEEKTTTTDQEKSIMTDQSISLFSCLIETTRSFSKKSKLSCVCMYVLYRSLIS